jgi:hypothetical protein
MSAIVLIKLSGCLFMLRKREKPVIVGNGGDGEMRLQSL